MWFVVPVAVLGLAVAAHGAANGPQYPWETEQLTAQDVAGFPDIGSVTGEGQGNTKTKCRAFPGTDDWPSEREWRRFNVSLGGALLKPVPAGVVCYPGPYYDTARCATVVANQLITRQHFSSPLGISTAWTADHPCPLLQKPTGACTNNGLPTYFVNATTVKQIQIAVNFARNKNLRLVVKNTGHDWVGRSIGAGALAIWTHHLKGFELITSFTAGAFTGTAAHVGSGIYAWEVHEAMAQHGVDLVAPSFSTVGAFGGYMLGGGHSTLTSYHGLASDQVLSLNLVTANGSFVTASPTTNPDLFFALRGGGGGTFGIVTSVVVKVHSPVNVTSVDLAISSLNVDVELFWKAMKTYFVFESRVVDAGGVGRTYVYPLNNATAFNFTTKLEFPGKTPDQVTAFIQPLLTSLSTTLSTILPPPPTPKTSRWAVQVVGEGAGLKNQRFASRLIPRAVWDSPTLYARAMAALRTICEQGGYEFHGTAFAPTLAVAGYPGNTSGVNPAFRDTVMHFVVYDSFKNGPGIADDVDRAARRRLSQYTDLIREVTAGGKEGEGGSYVNEADVEEPGWQRSWYGRNYEKLLEVKRRWDPEELFWATGMVGSEGWEVRTKDGKPHQNGKLCKVESGDGGKEEGE